MATFPQIIPIPELFSGFFLRAAAAECNCLNSQYFDELTEQRQGYLNLNPLMKITPLLPLAVTVAAISLNAVDAATYYFRGTSSNLTGTGSWSLTPGGGSAGVAPSTNDEAVFTTQGSLTPPLTIAGNATWGKLVWNFNASSTLAISTTQTSNRDLALSGGGGSTAAIAAGGASGDLIVLGSNMTSGTLAISGATNSNSSRLSLTLANSGNFNVVNAGATLAISSPIFESGGSRALNKTGAGTLLLYAPNSYTGGTTVGAGTLGGNGTIGALVVQNGGTLTPGTSDVN